MQTNVVSDVTKNQPVIAATVAPPPPQWMPMQYPAMVMQHHMIPPPHFPSHYMPYHPMQQQHHPARATSHQQGSGESSENRTIWVGDLHNWMDEDYLRNCFASTGEVLALFYC